MPLKLSPRQNKITFIEVTRTSIRSYHRTMLICCSHSPCWWIQRRMAITSIRRKIHICNGNNEGYKTKALSTFDSCIKLIAVNNIEIQRAIDLIRVLYFDNSIGYLQGNILIPSERYLIHLLDVYRIGI